MRDGLPVTKSKLALGPEAPQVAAYLKARAVDVRRDVATVQAGLHATVSSLVGMEWNALTYAGHTVWLARSGRTERSGQLPLSQDSAINPSWEAYPDIFMRIADDRAEIVLTQAAG